MTDIEAVPTELEAVGGPLSRVGELLRALAGDRRQLEQFGAGSPSAPLRQALAAFIERWELSVWHLGEDAVDLGAQVTLAGIWYRYDDHALATAFRFGPVPE